MTRRRPGRHTAAEDIPDKLVGPPGGRNLYPLVQAVIVVPRRCPVVDRNQVAVRIVGITVERVIGDVARDIVGKAG